MKYSYWLNMPSVFVDCSANILPFVECYTIFYGVAGKCENCFAQECCLKLNAEEVVSKDVKGVCKDEEYA